MLILYKKKKTKHNSNNLASTTAWKVKMRKVMRA